MTSSAALPRIALVATGGTIQLEGRNRLDNAHYAQVRKTVTASQLLERIQEVQSIATVEVIDFGWRRNVEPESWPDLSRLVANLLGERGFDGVVLTHGTSTLEETAYFLHLTVKTRRPIVITGSMRPPSSISSDADLNLLNAVRTAVFPDCAGLGVLVVLNDTIHCAREATKTATYRLQTFQSPDLGPLGYADADGQVAIQRQPRQVHTWQSEITAPRGVLPRVDIVVSYPGQDGWAIDAAVAARARGIVLAGTGAGGRTDGEDAALDRALAAGVAVVLASRTGSGRVALNPLVQARGIIAGNDLSPWKARVLLMLALDATRDPKSLQEFFDRY
jgi:L-asparaginase